MSKRGGFDKLSQPAGSLLAGAGAGLFWLFGAGFLVRGGAAGAALYPGAGPAGHGAGGGVVRHITVFGVG